MKFDDLPKNFAKSTLHRADLKENPFEQFIAWLEAAKAENVHELNAMALATANGAGKPSNRMVLLKGLDERGLVFYTNYESRKAKDLEENPAGSALFFWKEQMRQIIIEGKVRKLPKEESKTYFATRPRGSQLAVWVSKQDTIIESREVLEEKYKQVEQKYNGKDIPLPSYWGGYLLIPTRFEFWQGAPHRLHDRFEYLHEKGKWKISRLSP